MAKKKKSSNKWLTKLFILLGCIGILTVVYYLLSASLPERFVDPASGPTLLGRDFSVLAIIYNAGFAITLGFAAYFSFQAYKEKYIVASRKKRASHKVVVGSGLQRYVRQGVPYQGLAVIVVLLLVGAIGSLTSEPSSAQVVPVMQNVSYTKIADTPSGLKKANGKVIDTMEGGATDGKYIYLAFENPKGGGYIAKYDLNGKLVKTSNTFTPKQVGHANAMTYDSVRNRLVLAVYRVEGDTVLNRGKVTHFNPDTLNITISRYVTPETAVSNVCYSATTNQYISNGKLYDANLALVKKDLYNYSKYTKQYGDKKSAGQGIACDANHIYVIRYYANKTKPHTHVYVFDWSGKLDAVYNIKSLKDEAENIFILNNQLYMGVNNGTTYKGNSKDNKKDYLIRLDGVAVGQNSTTGSSGAIESDASNDTETIRTGAMPEENDTTE
jgi:hypothetical protein